MDKNKIIGFVLFVAIISAAYYVNDMINSYESQLTTCKSSNSDKVLVSSNERENFNSKIRTCESKLLDVINQADSYKSKVSECDGRIEAEKRTYIAVTQNYNNAMTQLKLCMASVVSTTTSSSTTTTIKKLTNTTV
jgi:uncharacterized coiled-coil DUF342 family protein